MKGKHPSSTINPARAFASLFGVLAGLGGMLHGVGEILQGNTVPNGIVINSWTVGPIATNMGGDPAMTIVPNFFVTGVLTLVISLALSVWAALCVQRKNSGWIQLCLTIAMLLVGGGFGPPTIGILASVAGIANKSPFTWWHEHLSANVRRFLAQLWPWVFGAVATAGLFLVIGHIILVFFFRMSNSTVFVASLFFIVLSFPLTMWTGMAYDLQNRDCRVSI